MNPSRDNFAELALWLIKRGPDPSILATAGGFAIRNDGSDSQPTAKLAGAARGGALDYRNTTHFKASIQMMVTFQLRCSSRRFVCIQCI
jgi:hypothetical protein